MISIVRGTVQLAISPDIITPYLAGLPAKWIECQKTRDASHYHLTILTPDESSAITSEDIASLDTKTYVIGLGTSAECYYLICHYPSADVFRYKRQLPPKDFHITIAFNGKDNHTVNKGLTTLVDPTTTNAASIILANKTCKDKSRSMFEALQKIGMDTDATNFELAKLYGNVGNYGAALETALRFKTTDLVKYYFITLQILHHQNLLTDSIVEEATEQLIGHPSSALIFDILNSRLKTAVLYEANGITAISKNPSNFSMVDELLAGSGIVSKSSINSVEKLHFAKIICLMEEAPDVPYAKHGITFEHYPIVDRYWKSIHSGASETGIMDTILASIATSHAASEKVLVHCLGGFGRTNVVLSCYLMKTRGFSPAEAMSFLEGQRKSKLTTPQIMFIKQYYVLLNAATPLTAIALPKLIMMIGAPCSGKTTLSNKFMIAYPRDIVHISQDDLGKKECMGLLMHHCKDRTALILDRCNRTAAERKEWLDLIFSDNIIAIYFKYPIETCKARLAGRMYHPTLASGRHGEKIIENVYNSIEPPTSKERFTKIHVITNDDDLDAVMKTFGL